jgi:hypothetical protein
VVAVPLGRYPTVSNGNYFIVAAVTDPHGTTTSVASNATVDIAAAVIDLAGSIISIPAAGTIGKSLAVTLEVSNEGNSIAAGQLLIAFAASPGSDGSNPFELTTLSTRINLAPGTSKMLHLKIPLAIGTLAGPAFLVATVDPNNAFADPNQANNVAISATPISLG